MKGDRVAARSESKGFAGKPVHILHVADNLNDVELVAAEIRGAGIACALQRVETRVAFVQALEREGWDLILSDFSLPAFDGLAALRLARKHRPEAPFLFVSGTLGEEAAIKALKEGATDYVLKTRLSKLVPAVVRALAEAEDRTARERVERALRTEEARLPARFLRRPHRPPQPGALRGPAGGLPKPGAGWRSSFSTSISSN